MRQIVLDTETTGLETSQDHRIIEIGCVELIGRKLTGRHYHQYVNPQRKVDEGAMEVHGITDEFLLDKPVFSQVVHEFLSHEIAKLNGKYLEIESGCRIIDTLALARQKHPGQKNNLDALCKRYGVDNSQRDLHGALLDAEILADVYLLMTGGQVNFNMSDQQASDSGEVSGKSAIRRLAADRPALTVVRASDAEIALHQQRLEGIDKKSGACVWLRNSD
jgi:DNA polymerase III subunit epsilon